MLLVFWQLYGGGSKELDFGVMFFLFLYVFFSCSLRFLSVLVFQCNREKPLRLLHLWSQHVVCLQSKRNSTSTGSHNVCMGRDKDIQCIPLRLQDEREGEKERKKERERRWKERGCKIRDYQDTNLHIEKSIACIRTHAWMETTTTHSKSLFSWSQTEGTTCLQTNDGATTTSSITI